MCNRSIWCHTNEDGSPSEILHLVFTSSQEYFLPTVTSGLLVRDLNLHPGRRKAPLWQRLLFKALYKYNYTELITMRSYGPASEFNKLLYFLCFVNDHLLAYRLFYFSRALFRLRTLLLSFFSHNNTDNWAILGVRQFNSGPWTHGRVKDPARRE